MILDIEEGDLLCIKGNSGDYIKSIIYIISLEKDRVKFYNAKVNSGFSKIEMINITKDVWDHDMYNYMRLDKAFFFDECIWI